MFNKEMAKAFRAGERPLVLGQACCQVRVFGRANWEPLHARKRYLFAPTSSHQDVAQER